MEKNMNLFYEEVKGIYRLRGPFEGIYTSVFLIQSGEKTILVDVPRRMQM